MRTISVMLKKLLASIVLMLGLLGAGASAAHADDRIVVPTPSYVQVDECGTANDRLVFDANDAPTGSVYGFVTYAGPTYNGSSGYIARVGTRSGYVFADGSTQKVTNLPAFTDVPCSSGTLNPGT